MEFHEKLQALRKQRGLTQEELAERLFVSRTAVSKWESGRGYPSIDSLKAISGFFGVTIDALLSGEEVLTLAREERVRSDVRTRDLVFGLLDCGAGLLLVLPLFGQRTADGVRAVALPALTGVQPYLKGLYLVLILLTALLGIGTLALREWEHPLWQKHRSGASMALGVLGTALFSLSRQPYAAVFFLVFLSIKGILLLKKP